MYKNIAITKVVLVSSMNYNTTEKDLRNFFADCGKITNIRFLNDKNDVPDGSAYVAFETHEMALKAYAKDDTCLRDRFLRVALNRTDAIEEIMTKKEDNLIDQPTDEKSQTNQELPSTKKSKECEINEKLAKNKIKSHKDSDKEHKHHHKHKHHKHHKHKKHHENEPSSDEGIRYYTELPE